MGKFSDTRFLLYNKNQAPFEYIRFDEMSEAISIPTNTTGILKTPLALSGTLQVVEDYAGTDSPLYLSTTAAKMDYTVQTANTAFDSFSLINSTAAASTLQQYSPAFVQTGYGYTASSVAISFKNYVVPTSGTAGYWGIDSKVGAGSWITRFAFGQNGALGINTTTLSSGMLTVNSTVSDSTNTAFVTSLDSGQELYLKPHRTSLLVGYWWFDGSGMSSGWKNLDFLDLNIGIGRATTTASSARLEVQGAANTDIARFYQSDGTSLAMTIGVGGAATTSFVGAVRTNFLNTYDNGRSIISNGSNTSTIIYDGDGGLATMYLVGQKVGIGTTSPSYKLEILEPNSGYIASIKTRTSAGGGFQYGGISNNTGAIWVSGESLGDNYILAANNSATSFGASGGGFSFRINQSSIAVFDSNGRLGIGTSTPTGILTIDALSVGVDVAEAGRTLTLRSTDTVTADKGPQIGFSGQSGGAANPYAYASIAGRKEGVGAYMGYLQFNTTTNTAGSISEKMRITAAGNVNIGSTTDLGARLGIKGSSGNTSLLVQNSAGTAALTVLDNGCVFANGNGAISTNTAFGENALRLSGSGDSNGAFGSGALRSLTTGSENTGVGRSSLYSTNSGINNVAIGNYSLFACTSGSNNTAFGWDSIEEGSTASNITSIGSGTRSGNFSGSIIIGKDATATAANQFVVGSTGTVAGTVDAEINASANVWNVVINGVARKILLA